MAASPRERGDVPNAEFEVVAKHASAPGARG